MWEDATSQGMLTVSSESEMTALLANENTRKYVKYVGESGTYIKDQIYELVPTADTVSFYELPILENEGTSDDIMEGKEFISSDGEKVVGTAQKGTTLNRYIAHGNLKYMAKIIYNAKSIISFANISWSMPITIGIREDAPMQILCSGNCANGTALVMMAFRALISGTRENPTSASYDQNRLVTINADGTITTEAYTPSASNYYIEYWNDTEITA